MKKSILLICAICLLGASCNSTPSVGSMTPPLSAGHVTLQPVAVKETATPLSKAMASVAPAIAQPTNSSPITGTLVVVRRATELSSTSTMTVSTLGIVSLPEGSMVSLTSGNYQDQDPRWSPNGQMIAFSSNRGGQYNVFLIDQNGSELAQLTDGDADKFSPVWSPDGKQLAYVLRKMGELGLEYSEINLIDLGTHEVKSLLKVPADDSERTILDLDWSPVDRNLLLYTMIEPVMSWQNEEYSATRVYLMNLQTNENTALTPDGWSCATPRWSPDGQLVLMNGCFSVGSDGGSFPMIGMLINSEAGFALDDLRLLESIAPATDIAWSPDGSMWVTDRFERDGTSSLHFHQMQGYLNATAYPLLAPFDKIAAVGRLIPSLLDLHTEAYSYRQPDWK